MGKLFYQPISPFFIGQKFGDNKACVDLATGTKVITCDGKNPPAGYRSVYGENGHLGIDLGAIHGQEVYCSLSGVVDSIDTDPRTGLDVRIVSEVDGEKFRCIYEHLLGYQPKIGDIIETGQLIGWADNTGWSSGDHLHWQTEIWTDAGGKGWDPFDPIPFTENMFAKDYLYFNNRLKYLREQVALLADRIADYLRRK